MYSTFKIASESDSYRPTIEGYSGDAGNILKLVTYVRACLYVCTGMCLGVVLK